MDLLGYILFIFAGLFFGLFGSGGSIIIIPVLIYIFKIPIYEATTYSLLLVFLVSFFGTWKHIKTRNFNINNIIYFALPSLLFTCFSRAFLFPSIPTDIPYFNISKHTALMILFSIIVFFCGISLLKNRTIYIHINLKVLLVLMGVFVGLLSGLLGVGGGFIIVPSLIIFANMNIKESAASALFVISLNTCLALVLEVTVFQFKFDFLFISYILISGLIGLILGLKLLNKIDVDIIKKMFSISLLFLSLGILIIELL